MEEPTKNKEAQLFTINYICKGNVSRSPTAQAITQSIIEEKNLEGVLGAPKSSGFIVNSTNQWGKTEDSNLKWETIIKVLRVAYNNGFHKMTQYGNFVEGVISNEEKAKESHDNDRVYRNELNRAAAKAYQIVEVFDKASTMLTLAEHNLVYPVKEPMQFSPDGSAKYIVMDAENTPKVEDIVRKAGETASVLSFDNFIESKMEGSLAAIKYHDGILDLRGFRRIYEQIEKGCQNIVNCSIKEVSGK